MERRLRGRVWKFGDDIDTDVMAPWNSMGLPWEETRKMLFPNRPDFAAEVRPGDMVVGGRNWGCGSSRENAPANLKQLGVAAVVAESFGRIYFRNSVAIAFPHVVCPGVSAAFEDGDELELDVVSARVRNTTRGVELEGVPYTAEMLEIVEKGGLLEVLKERLAERDVGARP